MARLPKIGEENWGNVLNEFLLVSHNADGTEKVQSANDEQTASASLQSDLIQGASEASKSVISVGAYASDSENVEGGALSRLSALEKRLGNRLRFDGYTNVYPKTNTPGEMNPDILIYHLKDGRGVNCNLELADTNGNLLISRRSTGGTLGEILQSWTNRTETYYLQIRRYLLGVKQGIENTPELQPQTVRINFATLHEFNDATYVWGNTAGNDIHRDYRKVFDMFIQIIDEIFPYNEYPNISVLQWLNRYNGADSMAPLHYPVPDGSGNLMNGSYQSLIYTLEDSPRIKVGFTNYIRAGDRFEGFARSSAATMSWLMREINTVPIGRRAPLTNPECSVNTAQNDVLINSMAAWKDLGSSQQKAGFEEVTFFLADKEGRQWNVVDAANKETFVEVVNDLQRGTVVEPWEVTTNADQTNLCTDPFPSNLDSWFTDAGGETPLSRVPWARLSSDRPLWAHEGAMSLEIDTGGLGQGINYFEGAVRKPYEDGYKRRFYQKIPNGTISQNDLLEYQISARIAPSASIEEAFIDVGVRQGKDVGKTRHKLRLTKVWQMYGTDDSRVVVPVKPSYDGSGFWKVPYLEVGQSLTNVPVQISVVIVKKTTQFGLTNYDPGYIRLQGHRVRANYKKVIITTEVLSNPQFSEHTLTWENNLINAASSINIQARNPAGHEANSKGVVLVGRIQTDPGVAYIKLVNVGAAPFNGKIELHCTLD